jgi:large subunit ribosomal protein L20
MRVKRGIISRRRHKKMAKMAKGFRGRRKSCFKIIKPAVEKSLKYAYRDRRVRKRDFRSLWITRISAAAKQLGLTYSRLIGLLGRSDVTLNRKMLADIAVVDPACFAQICKKLAA